MPQDVAGVPTCPIGHAYPDNSHKNQYECEHVDHNRHIDILRIRHSLSSTAFVQLPVGRTASPAIKGRREVAGSLEPAPKVVKTGSFCKKFS